MPEGARLILDPPHDGDLVPENTPRNTLLLYLYALKRPVKEIAKFFDLTVKQVKDILRLPSMRAAEQKVEAEVQEWVKDMVAGIVGGDAVEAYFKAHAVEAAEKKVEHMRQEDDLGVSSRSATDILEFAGHGKKEAPAVSVNVIQLPEAQAQLLVDTEAEVRELPVAVEVVEVAGD